MVSAFLRLDQAADWAGLLARCPTGYGGGFPDQGLELCDGKGMNATGRGEGPIDPDQVKIGRAGSKKDLPIAPGRAAALSHGWS